MAEKKAPLTTLKSNLQALIPDAKITTSDDDTAPMMTQEYDHHIASGEEAMKRCNELMIAPIPTTIRLPDGRTLDIRSWKPTASCDDALSVEINAYIMTDKPKQVKIPPIDFSTDKDPDLDVPRY